jgi:hypothetical protein
MSESSTEDIRRELQEIEETLQRLRSERPGGVDDTIGDRSDQASDLVGYEEEQALIENLEARKQTLLQRLNAN